MIGPIRRRSSTPTSVQHQGISAWVRATRADLSQRLPIAFRQRYHCISWPLRPVCLDMFLRTNHTTQPIWKPRLDNGKASQCAEPPNSVTLILYSRLRVRRWILSWQSRVAVYFASNTQRKLPWRSRLQLLSCVRCPTKASKLQISPCSFGRWHSPLQPLHTSVKVQ